MCCTLERAVLSKTILYVGEAKTEKHGVVHVLGYQNRVQNLSAGPNAMILPFPAIERMTKENVIDTSACKNILKNMESAISPPVARGGLSLLGSRSLKSVQIFEHDIYTVVLAKSALDIYDALSEVPKLKRPPLNKKIFNAYDKWYREQNRPWQIMLCCFNNKDASVASPLLWWYKPMHPGTLFAPALDSHTGEVPNLNEPVPVDHTLVVSSQNLKNGSMVYFTDRIDEKVYPYLPNKVLGSQLDTFMRNGDFLWNIDEIDNGQFRPMRVART